MTERKPDRHNPATSRALRLVHYMLDEQHRVIATYDLMEWARWFETADRRVRLTRVGPYHVSTIFLGLDHSYDYRQRLKPAADYQPLIFETMVWIYHKTEHAAIPEYGIKAWTSTRDFEEIQERCHSWDEALAQHQAIVDQLQAANIHDTVEELGHDDDVREEDQKS